MRLFKWIWFMPVLFVGGIATIICGVGAIAMGRAWTRFGGAVSKNPGYVWVYLYWYILRMLCFALGITVRIRSPTGSFKASSAIIGDHGSDFPLVLQALHAAVFFPLRTGVTIKIQHLRNIIGKGMKSIGVGVPLEREDRDKAIAALKLAVNELKGNILIFAPGTRPKPEKIEDSRRELAKRGFVYASQLRYTTHPKPKGPWTVIQALSPSTIYLQLVAASIDDTKGILAIVDLMFGGAIFLEYEEVTDQFDREDFQRFADQLTNIFVRRVGPWIGEQRECWERLSAGEKFREYIGSLRTIF